MFSLSVIQPVEEVLVCTGSLPFGMVSAEVGAVSVFLVDHFKPVLQIFRGTSARASKPFSTAIRPTHHLRCPFPFTLCLGLSCTPALTLFRGQLLLVRVRASMIRIVSTSTACYFANATPVLFRSIRRGARPCSGAELVSIARESFIAGDGPCCISPSRYTSSASEACEKTL